MNRCPWSRLGESWFVLRGATIPVTFSQAELIAWTLEHTEAGVDWQWTQSTLNIPMAYVVLMPNNAPMIFCFFGESGMKHGWSMKFVPGQGEHGRSHDWIHLKPSPWQGILKTLDHQSWNSRWLEVLAKENERGFHPTTLGHKITRWSQGESHGFVGLPILLHRGFQSMALVIPRRSNLRRLFCIAKRMDWQCFVSATNCCKYIFSAKFQWHLRDEGIILSNYWFWIK